METIIAAIIGALTSLGTVFLGHYLKKRKPKKKSEDLCFDRVSLIITITRWCSKTSQPLVKDKRISYLGKEYSVNIKDESIIYTEWIPAQNCSGNMKRTHATSGLIIFEPISQYLVDIDELAYHRSGGKHINTWFTVESKKHISYITRRFNGFQHGQEDFSLPFKDLEIHNLCLNINFEPILGTAAFKKMPKAAMVLNGESGRETEVRLDSWYGKSWKILENLSNKRGHLYVRWELTDGFPEGDIYIFGYGSLIHPKSVSKTLPKFEPDNRSIIPARLKGFRRCWTAFSKNRRRSTTEKGVTLPYIAYMNLEVDRKSSSLGGLVKVSSEELTLLDTREWIYVRLDVSNGIEIICDHSEEISKKATIFTFISIPPKEFEDIKKSIGVRKDYIDLIKTASSDIDRYLKCGISYVEDFEKILEQTRGMEYLYPADEEDRDRYQINQK